MAPHPPHAADRRPTPTTRWTLNRAGIVNVYQYENETIGFGGGRLLLRGVNGSGKSTAMNMLLPFLVTASLRRIDAAGEQTGVLKSWMLSGRDDAQPVGYLWLEFRRGDEFLVCGCGVKANRSTDNLRTWWFITDRRPGVDLSLVEGQVPLSDDALRAELGADAVFPHDRRPDYRAEIRRRLFGGADLEQHLQLLNAVRNPRVGDRIDLDLPLHLTNALPELSARAVAEAARPLDDLDEHRRNVAALEATSAALSAMTGVYRSYLRQDVQGRVDRGRRLLTDLDALHAEATRLGRDQKAAGSHRAAVEAEIVELSAADEALTAEIAALQASPEYQEGAKLEDLAERVREAESILRDLAERLSENRDRQEAAGRAVTAGRNATDRARAELADQLDELGRLRAATRVAALAPAPPPSAHEPLTEGLTSPVGALDTTELDRALSEVAAGAVVRVGEIDEVVNLNRGVDTALATLTRAEERLDDRRADLTQAETAHDKARRGLTAATEAWDEAVATWRAETAELVDELAARPDDDHNDRSVDLNNLLTGERPAFADHNDRVGWRNRLADLADEVVGDVHRANARADHAHQGAIAARDEAARVAAELDALIEPPSPVLEWQHRTEPCLADLVDFQPTVADRDRAGLEAALEASGLLMATVVADTHSNGLELENGDLVLTATAPSSNTNNANTNTNTNNANTNNANTNNNTVEVASPLSDLLTVTVPDTASVSADVVARVLGRISTSVSDAVAGSGDHVAAAVTVDGRFRLGPAVGRHTKSAAEFIGLTARRRTLERRRTEARERLAEADAYRESCAADHRWWRQRLGRAEEARRSLPGLTEVELSRRHAAEAEEQLGRARDRLAEADDDRAEAEAEHRERVDHADRVARNLQLPRHPDELDRVASQVVDLRSAVSTCRPLTEALRSRREQWRAAADDWRQREAEGDRLESERGRRRQIHDGLSTRLATLRESIGRSYQDVVDQITADKDQLDSVRAELPQRRAQLAEAVAEQARIEERVRTVDGRQAEAEAEAVAALELLDRALALDGIVDALTPSNDQTITGDETSADDRTGAAAADGGLPALTGPVEASSAGLRDRLDRLARLIVASDGPATVTTADGLRLSLRQRRDSLGSGWDAEARQPDERLPIVVIVEGPLGVMALPAAAREASRQLDRLSALLTAKQDDALRGLLQGLVANEVAEKMDAAGHLVSRMNQHLRKVRTAHGLGVELRWRRRSELDGIDGAMIDLLAKLPDLRTEDETAQLREMVSAHLNEERALNPEASYRELIATSLDYRRWHEMTVLTRWGDEAPKRLGRNHRFSEGEKKLVTYLPFLAAVAVSCDALAEHSPTAARFVLLDDAMAKVSEDNHADLLGLLVDLDLDFIATSERLWGTHATVPELAITEVVRDAELGVILLDHFRWDGATLVNRPAADDPSR